MNTTPSQPKAEGYRNFTAAIYARAYEVIQMRDLDWLQSRFDVMSRRLKATKIYLETHRDTLMPDRETIIAAKRFFEERGIQTAGGITYTINERNRFQTYCYSSPEDRQKVAEIAAFTASLFDEMILDDFFFTNCKCPRCIAAKGERSWTEFRLELMADAARDLILAPAHAANPNVKVVIKYPNWYEHFQGLGFNLEAQPPLFDGIHTGTETRDPSMGNQHLQQYESYLIIRYFEAIKPGHNGGGWVDPFGSQTLDRYAEQLWLTLFAKAPEQTLFDFRSLQRPIQMSDRAPWQGNGNSFDFDTVIGPLMRPDFTLAPEATIAYAAGAAFEQVDSFLGELGEPIGVKAYKPFHSTGEDFLHNYFGMLGIPMDLVPAFPAEANPVLLTECAKADPAIVQKIKGQLLAGKDVVVTSGFWRAMQDHGMRDIVELTIDDRKALVHDYQVGWMRTVQGTSDILIPHLQYLTNDSWEEVSGVSDTTGHPILHKADYGAASLYVLTIPDNFNDLYKLPAEVLARIRELLCRDLYVHITGPGKVALFAYDNHTFIVESFLPEPTTVGLAVKGAGASLHELVSGEVLTAGTPLRGFRGQPTGETAFSLALPPHAYRVYRLETAES